MKDFAKKLDDVANIVEPIASTTGKFTAAIGEAAIATVPFAKFVPLISEIGNVLNEIVEIVQAAEHNKRTCKALLQRVRAAGLAVFDLKIRRDENKEFFVNRNYLYLQNLVNVIVNIEKFVKEISQMNTLMKYLKAKSVEKTFSELCREFDSWINLLSFTILIKEKIRVEDEAQQLKSDQEDLYKYLTEMGVNVKEIGTDVKEFKGEFSSMVLKINTMNNKMEKILDEQNKSAVRNETNVEYYQNKIDKIFTESNKLDFTDYKETNEQRNDGPVNQDPEFRPKITDMFKELRNILKEFIKASPSPINSQKQIYVPPKLKKPPIPTPQRQFSMDQDEFVIKYEDLPDSESFNYMTLAEAELQHRLDKEKVIAELFKEVADDEANEFPEAKLRYGDCLHNGKGVNQNLEEALKYFEKAAENGLKWQCCGGAKRDEQKAIYYMKLAAYNEYIPAIKFCKEHHIDIE
ncbi:11916_t:CDS:2 [Funneliformis mosseae]|uniref:11916_t:CDS:1 n=1 Tax=Funneliformis mosseae TaxID=27381 RepID=A0A9N9FDC9_FUNMO|nr:11916_t:CDS:2 [Funneliformis mosseae]